VNVFGGGLALYGDGNGNSAGGIRNIGAIGVSGDACRTDHAVAWHIRDDLQTVGGGSVGNVPAGFHSGSARAAYVERRDEMVIGRRSRCNRQYNVSARLCRDRDN
jgi:hypothetical protein